jgi:hypothetical protein
MVRPIEFLVGNSVRGVGLTEAGTPSQTASPIPLRQALSAFNTSKHSARNTGRSCSIAIAWSSPRILRQPISTRAMPAVSLAPCGSAKSATARTASASATFLVLHQHESLPHGDQILSAIESGELEPRHYRGPDGRCPEGRRALSADGRVGNPSARLASVCDRDIAPVDAHEEARIETFSIDELRPGAA